MKPSEVYLGRPGNVRRGNEADEIAAGSPTTATGEHRAVHRPASVIDHGKHPHQEFAGIFPASFVTGLSRTGGALTAPGDYPDADPGIPTLG